MLKVTNSLLLGMGMFAGFMSYTPFQLGIITVPLAWALWSSGFMLAAYVMLDSIRNHFGNVLARLNAEFNFIFNERVQAMIAAAVAEAITARVKGQVVPLSAAERQTKSIALSFLNAARASTDDATRIPTAGKMSLAPATWQARVNLIREHLTIIKTGSNKGTYIASRHGDIGTLIHAVETGGVRLTTPLPTPDVDNHSDNE